MRWKANETDVLCLMPSSPLRSGTSDTWNTSPRDFPEVLQHHVQLCSLLRFHCLPRRFPFHLALQKFFGLLRNRVSVRFRLLKTVLVHGLLPFFGFFLLGFERLLVPPTHPSQPISLIPTELRILRVTHGSKSVSCSGHTNGPPPAVGLPGGPATSISTVIFFCARGRNHRRGWGIFALGLSSRTRDWMTYERIERTGIL